MKALRLAACAAALTISSIHTAHAIDGQIDVAPDGATPFVISASGAYVLVKNVTMTANVDCIQITASNVTLDLNGHTLAGTGAGTSADGIDMAANSDLAVSNGVIRNFGGRGISGGGGAIRVDEIAATGCLDVGIYLHTGTSHRVTNSTARENTSYGIHVGGSSRVENCLASGNNKLGITSGIVASGNNSFIVNCIANNNKPTGTGGGIGILALDRTTIQNCTASGNSGTTTGDGIGINATSNCNISASLADGNLGAGTGKGVGFQVTTSCRVTDSVATNNKGGTTGDGIGISTGDYSQLLNNSCTGNFSGTSSGTGVGILGSDADNCVIQGNDCSGNRGVAAGLGIGIRVGGSYNRIEGNAANDNTAPAAGLAAGILATGFAQQVVGNSVDSNFSQTGGGVGILTGGGALIDSNVVTGVAGRTPADASCLGISGATGVTIRNNQVEGTTNFSAGGAIGISGDDRSLIENNRVSGIRGGVGSNSTGILALADCVVRGNLSSVNGIDTNAVTYGIKVGDRCTVENNTASNNIAGTEAGGILAKTFCLVQNNHAEDNDSKVTGGQNFGTGISADAGSVVRLNMVARNSAAPNGNGFSAGIIVDERCLVENNSAISNSASGTESNGILVIGASPGETLVRGNYTVGHITRGIYVSTTGNRSELNRSGDTIDVVAGNVLATGELADISF